MEMFNVWFLPFSVCEFCSECTNSRIAYALHNVYLHAEHMKWLHRESSKQRENSQSEDREVAKSACKREQKRKAPELSL